MHLEYSCFISYPHFQNELVEQVTTELHEALSVELEIYGAPPVFLDRSRVAPGEQFARSMAKALCESASMVLIFVPASLSQKNLNGAQEFLAMEQLERQRLEHLPKGERQGLIVPVILRGTDHLPTFVKERQCIDFSDFMLFDHKLSNNPVYATKIQQIARYVDECYRAISALRDEHGGDCESFSLPSAEQTRLWLQKVPAQAPRFPSFR